MATSVADFLLARLREWEVDRVFGYPGDGINGLRAAWGKAGNKPVFVRIPDVSYAGFAKSIGLGSDRIEKPDGIGAAWERAMGASRPHVLEFATDPAVPPIPPPAALDQTGNMVSALAQGDSDWAEVIKVGFKEKLQELIPGKGR
jgi:thiamine pyrophosphate-dependent acetolactate synthase large subunit-like protein